MDTWKFYEITHREHVVCNPTSEDKLARLVELLRLPTDAQVVDIACGKGEFLIRLAEAYGACGVGIDISPFHVADAKRRLVTRASAAGRSPRARLRLRRGLQQSRLGVDQQLVAELAPEHLVDGNAVGLPGQASFPSPSAKPSFPDPMARCSRPASPRAVSGPRGRSSTSWTLDSARRSAT